jgi:Leucine-rich repeat (LRR) protein
MDQAWLAMMVLAASPLAVTADVGSPERILHFPTDWSVGSLSSRPARREEPTYVSHYRLRDGDWERLGDARGDVAVPMGHQVAFSAVRLREWRDLSPLLELQPDDIYRLSIHGSYSGGSRPGDSCMEYVAHLTGLRILDLSATNVSGAAMKYVASMKGLIQLTVPARMDDQGMALIAGLPSLRGLYLDENRVTDAGLAHVAKLITLEELKLGGGKITDNGLVPLAQLPHLKYLALWGEGFTNGGFRHLKNIPNVEILDFGSLHQVTDDGVAHIAEISQVTEVSLHWSKNITDGGLSHLKKLPRLRRLDIGWAKVTDAGMAHLKAIPTLESLRLPPMGISDKGLKYLSELPRLRELDLPWMEYVDPNMGKNGYSDEGVKALSKCASLEHLGIGGAGITDEGIRQVARLSRLRSLSVSGSGAVSDESVEALAGLRSLETLRIEGFRLTISAAKSFNALVNLRTLILEGVAQDNSGLDLSGLVNLRELSVHLQERRVNGTVQWDRFDERDIAAIGKLTGLRRLAVSHHGVTNAALKSLTGLKRLEDLFIGGEALTDDGLAYLAELPHLNRLTLSGHFTDAGLVHVQKLQNLGMLEFVSGADFTARALSDFRASMPNLGLYRNREKKQEPRSE